jgi:GNAT superfamily N-acetyltransferase
VSLEIRTVTAGDLSTLAPLVAGFRDHLGVEKPTDADLAAHLPRLLADPSIEFACAWLAGEPVGYTQMRFYDSIWELGFEAHLEDLFVLASARRASVGRALLDHAVACAGARGAKRVSLLTNEKNEVAHVLYRAAGFEPDTHPVYGTAHEVLWILEEVGAP